jgi:hypothetical protein
MIGPRLGARGKSQPWLNGWTIVAACSPIHDSLLASGRLAVCIRLSDTISFLTAPFGPRRYYLAEDVIRGLRKPSGATTQNASDWLWKQRRILGASSRPVSHHSLCDIHLLGTLTSLNPPPEEERRKKKKKKKTDTRARSRAHVLEALAM